MYRLSVKKNVLQFDIGFIYAKGLHIVSVSQIQPGTYFVDKVLFQQATLVLCILSLLLHTIIILACKFLSQVTRFFQESICSYHLVSTAQGLAHSTGSLPSIGGITTAKMACFSGFPVREKLQSCNKAYDLKSLKYYYRALYRKNVLTPDVDSDAEGMC